MHRDSPPRLALTLSRPIPATPDHVALRTSAAARTARVNHVYDVAPVSEPGRLVSNCPFCRTAESGGDHCEACGAPLSPPPDPQLPALGRRAAPRIERQDRALMNLPGSAVDYTVRLQDMSFTGLALEAGLAVRPPGVVRVRATSFDAVAQVLECRRSDYGYMLHGQLLTLRLLRLAGAFVSARA